MSSKRFLLIPSRTSNQGKHINIGKFTDEYNEIVTTLTACREDMESIGIVDGDAVILRTEHGEAEFTCKADNVPEGMLVVPYGPPTCKLMGGDTDGTGMPTSKGWEVEVEKVAS